jgi:hypothetical protein
LWWRAFAWAPGCWSGCFRVRRRRDPAPGRGDPTGVYTRQNPRIQSSHGASRPSRRCRLPPEWTRTLLAFSLPLSIDHCPGSAAHGRAGCQPRSAGRRPGPLASGAARILDESTRPAGAGPQIGCLPAIVSPATRRGNLWRGLRRLWLGLVLNPKFIRDSSSSCRVAYDVPSRPGRPK